MLSYSKSPGFLGDFDFLFEKTLYRAYSEDFLPIQKIFSLQTAKNMLKYLLISFMKKI